MRNGLLIALLVAALAAVAGWFAWRQARGAAEAVSTVPTVEVRRGPFAVTLTSIGELRAAKSSVLSSPFEGKIVKLLPEGATVNAGDPVIWFETEDIQRELDDQMAQLELDKKNLQTAADAYELEKIKNQYTLEAERTRVEIARRNLEDAQQKFEAEKVLFEKNVSAQTQLDQRRLALLQAELSLRNAQINLAKVEENLAANLRVREQDIEKERLRMDKTQRRVGEAQRKVDSAIVRSESPGDVSYLKIWKGGTVGKITEGDQVWRRSAVAEIPDTSEMHAVIPVNEIDVSRIEVGQRAEVEIVALPGRVFPAAVMTKSIVPITDPTARSWDRSGTDAPGPREFEVRVRLDETHPSFRQGMTASARVYLMELPDAVQVPLEAVVRHQGREGVWTATTPPAFLPLEVIAINDHFAAVQGDLPAGTAVYLGSPFQTPSKPGNTPPAASAEPLPANDKNVPAVPRRAGADT